MDSTLRCAEAVISSAIKNEDGEAESIKYSLSAEYGYSGENAEIRYRENTDQGIISTVITVRGGAVRVVRTGDVNSDIILSEGLEHKSVYSVGAFAFDMSVTAKKIRSGLCESGGRLDILYKMTVGGAEKDVHFGIRIGVDSK